MDLTKISDKEIQFNIMMALMKIEGHMSEMVMSSASVEMLSGGEINDLAGIDKQD